MKVKVTEDYEEMSDAAAEMVLQEIREKPDCVLGLTGCIGGWKRRTVPEKRIFPECASSR